MATLVSYSDGWSKAAASRNSKCGGKGESSSVKRAASLAGIALTLITGPMADAQSQVTRSIWGHTADGTAVPIYEITGGRIKVRVAAWGARLVSVRTPDRAGKMADIVLGYDTLQDYVNDTKTYFGSTVGRYGNRIALGKFTLDGKTYQIPVNNGANALHGGTVGFDRKVWDSHQIPDGVEFTLVSPDGDMGFPGTLTLHVRYTLVGDTLKLDYSATTDKTTVLNVTNHAYFNLSGDDHGDVLGQRVEIRAQQFTPVDAGLIPTGELAPVAGTPLDFRKPEAIGARINDRGSDSGEQMKLGNGYDFNWVVDGAAGKLRTAAIVTDAQSGRELTVATTEPGIQFYSGNFLDGSFTGRHGAKYTQHAGFCLETQHYPDSPNHANFPSTVLHPGQAFHSTTTLTFSTIT
jgi:aldose 1-epimerase